MLCAISNEPVYGQVFQKALNEILPFLFMGLLIKWSKLCYFPCLVPCASPPLKDKAQSLGLFPYIWNTPD